MHVKRVIPCLDVRAGRVVKGTRFIDLRDAGDPVELAEHYDREGADELVFLDINASHEGRATMLDVASRTAEKVFIPFTVGGGIRTVGDIRSLLPGCGQGFSESRQSRTRRSGGLWTCSASVHSGCHRRAQEEEPGSCSSGKSSSTAGFKQD